MVLVGGGHACLCQIKTFKFGAFKYRTPSQFSRGSRRWNLVEFMSSFLTDTELRKKGDVVLICTQVALIDFVRLENWPLLSSRGGSLSKASVVILSSKGSGDAAFSWCVSKLNTHL